MPCATLSGNGASTDDGTGLTDPCWFALLHHAAHVKVIRNRLCIEAADGCTINAVCDRPKEQ
jgi:hypothetical protein